MKRRAQLIVEFFHILMAHVSGLIFETATKKLDKN